MPLEVVFEARVRRCRRPDVQAGDMSYEFVTYEKRDRIATSR